MYHNICSPPKASRTVEMSNNRIKIINPLSLPTCDNVAGPAGDRQDIHQNYQVYNSTSAPVTPKAMTPNRFTVEPLSLAPLNSTAIKISATDTVNSSGNAEFPSSALDLYTTLLNEIEGGGDSSNEQQISHPSPPKLPPPAVLGAQGSSSGILEVSRDLNDFEDYQPGSKQPLRDRDELAGIKNLDQSLGMRHSLVSNLGDETSHSAESAIGDFKSSFSKTLDFSCGKIYCVCAYKQ